ncbi:MAG: hypothetical protein K2L89_03730 [Muribaculaceae bacterium]|nr:hypothetical protein [Muribaculaceae bacterium]
MSEVKLFDKIAPASVTNLKATPAGDGSIGCTLTWELPTVDILGEELTGDKAIEKVLVYRDEETIPVELAADATTYTDTEAAGLTGGKHTYSVTVVAGGNESSPTKVNSGRVGPAVAVSLPAILTMEAETDFEEWTIRKGEESTVENG